MQSSQFKQFSQKQLELLSWWCDESPFHKYDAIICDGAVRSGKTVCMSLSFVFWAFYRFCDQSFALCGKTVTGLRRNVITPLMPLLSELGFQCNEQISKNLLEISKGGRKNRFYYFGGKDESSAALIQGMTLAGVMLDEAALMPRSFCEQAIARCSVEGSRLWFNCNPEHPAHWFYREWVCQPEKHNAIRLHFLLEDNPSLSQRIIDRYKSMYTGVFYNRYILGEWCVAEGLVYDFGEDNIVDEIPSNGEYYISIDYGTMNPFSAGLWCVLGDKATRIKEYYYNGREKAVQRTDEDYCDSVEELAKGYNIRQIVVDPSAASFIAALRRRGFTIRKANNDVLDGIRRTAVYLKNGNIKIHRSCVDTIAEFGLYRWDDKAPADTVIKENDHAMDDIRYFCNTIMKNKVRKESNYTPIFM